MYFFTEVDELLETYNDICNKVRNFFVFKKLFLKKMENIIHKCF